MSISLRRVGHTYGQNEVLSNLDLEVEPGELLCVLGPSGSGKSTILKLLAGLELLQEGEIQLGEQVITSAQCPPPEQRAIGLVFQEHALFPHLTVSQNLAFGLGKLDKSEQTKRVDDLLAKTELEEFRDRLPSMLSGGQQQRVALARALAPAPEVLLLDEPFASVDVLLKTRLREEMRGMLKALGSTSILVTHDPEDALMLADRVAVIVAGKLVQIGEPKELWRDPAHAFVAEVFANQQVIEADREGENLITAFGTFAGIPSDKGIFRFSLAVNPLHISVKPVQISDVLVTDIRFAGDYFQIYLSAKGQQLVAHTPEPPSLEINQPVAVDIASENVHAYNRE